MLDERKLAVLRAIVTDYVNSREPVGSKTLVERYHLDVSPATVRNDMAVLEEEGYIAQPHTSAGRIPTDKGYRLFVDRLAGGRQLSRVERNAITTFLTGAVDLDDIVTRTVRLLAQVTSQVAIMQYPTVQTAVIRHIDIIRLQGARGLLILVDSLGKVAQRMIHLAGAGDDDLVALRDRINQTLAGLNPRQAVTALADVSTTVTPDLRGLATAAAASILDIVTAEASAKVVVAGVNNLAQFSDDFETSVRPVLETLEEQVVLLHLLGEATSEVSVRIGQENQHAALATASVVASGYGPQDATWAGLGVVGPIRMDYPSTIASVRAVARYVSRLLAEG